jgi:hypothetical protein
VVEVAALPKAWVKVAGRLLEVLNESHQVRLIAALNEKMDVIWHEAVRERVEAAALGA